MSIKGNSKNHQQQPEQSFRKKAHNKKKDIKIEIQLKGGQGKSQTLDENLIKVIENEYAVRYLEQLGLSATQNNIDLLLKKAPLTTCEFQALWNNSGWLADSVTIFPIKKEKKTFDNQREEMIN